MDFEKELKLLKAVFRDSPESELRKTLQKFKDATDAIFFLSKTKSIQVEIHENCPDFVRDAAVHAMETVQCATVKISRTSEPYTITIFFQKSQIKPVIYVNPILNPEKCESIESYSIILLQEDADFEIQTLCAFRSILILPLNFDSVQLAIKKVLVLNGVIGTSEHTCQKGDTWSSMLMRMPNVSTTYMNAISSMYPSPIEFVTSQNGPIVLQSQRAIPENVMTNLSIFYTDKDPNKKLDFQKKKMASFRQDGSEPE